MSQDDGRVDAAQIAPGFEWYQDGISHNRALGDFWELEQDPLLVNENPSFACGREFNTPGG